MKAEKRPFIPTHNDETSDLEDSAFIPYISKSNSAHSWKSSFVQIATTFILACSFGILIGYNSRNPISPKPSTYGGGLLRPEGAITEIWEHNFTFSQAPTPASEDAWNTLIPPGRGFIHQPEIAPFISNIAVFHQIHCLHAVLVAYYASTDNLAHVLAGEDIDEAPELYGAQINTNHIRHCFDYLRRSIMCAADTNLEVVDRVNHTTNGWGQEKTCRDYGEVVAYARLWANTSDTGIVQGEAP